MTAVESNPAWLVSAVDQRAATLKHMLPADVIRHFHVLVTPLTSPDDESEEAYARWDNSCDNCHNFCPEDLETRAVHVNPIDGVPVVLMVGACSKCWAAK